jgi:hypothetical protein
MKRATPSIETEFAHDDVAHYLAILQEWREDLEDIATGALDAAETKTLEEEHKNLRTALKSLDSIGKLVKIVLDPYARTLGLIDEQRQPTWLINGTADFTKLMNIAAANASKLTAQEREYVAYGLSCVWGAISSVVVIGSHGLKNAITQRLLRDGAAQAATQNDPTRSTKSCIDIATSSGATNLRSKKPGLGRPSKFAAR